MATWRVENSMLTQRGVEILNKLKAGIGSITVTRIVAGSGRVSESQLYPQTSISGVIKEMTISSKNTFASGSEISFYITNTEFTESFDLHQLGVYVTHPDYEGEQLYHISQCDEEDFDTIPAMAETPVTQGYSIFMEHGNSSSIELTVDPQGMISRPEFEKLSNNFYHLGWDILTPTTTGYATLYDYIKHMYIEGKFSLTGKVSDFTDLPQTGWVFSLVARNGEVDSWDVKLIKANTTQIYVRQLNTNSTWLQDDWAEVVTTGNLLSHSAPVGLVYETVIVSSNSEINSALTTWIDSTPANQIRNFILSVSVTGLNLGGGDWFITISKTNSQYASIIATKHNTSGVYIKACSLNEGVITDWVTVTPTTVVDAVLE